MGMFDEVIDNAGEAFKGGKGFEHGTHDVLIMEAKAVEKKTEAKSELKKQWKALNVRRVRTSISVSVARAVALKASVKALRVSRLLSGGP